MVWGSRREIESIDRSIVYLLAARAQAVQRLQQYKRTAGLPARDDAQARRVIERAQQWARETGISADLVEQLFDRLLAEAVRVPSPPGHPYPPRMQLVTVHLARPAPLPVAVPAAMTAGRPMLAAGTS